MNVKGEGWEGREKGGGRRKEEDPQCLKCIDANAGSEVQLADVNGSGLYSHRKCSQCGHHGHALAWMSLI